MPLVDEILSFYMSRCFFEKTFLKSLLTLLAICENTFKLTLRSLFYKISPKSYWVWDVNAFLIWLVQISTDWSESLNSPILKKSDSTNLIIQKTSDFSILHCQICQIRWIVLHQFDSVMLALHGYAYILMFNLM